MNYLLRFSCLALLASATLFSVGCTRPIEAISVSNSNVDFGLNTLPFSIQVWNDNPEADTIRIQARPNRTWIKLDVASVESDAPPTASGPFDKKGLRITIDRNQLNRGVHEGQIELGGEGLVPLVVGIRVESDRDNNGAPLNILNVETKYRRPYLVEFSFALRDANGSAVVAEPSQFTVTAQEGANPVTFLNGLQLRRAAARQLKAELLLDYSLAQPASAIAAMEDAAKNVFLPALNDDALVGITEFHLESDPAPAQRVAEFTTDRDFLQRRINAIQDEFVQGFSSFPRIFDSIVQVAGYYNDGDPEKEDRYIVLFSNGDDISSTASANDAVDACEDRNIKIYTVGVGDNVDELTLTDLSNRTGGLYFPADTAADLAEAFEKIVNDLEAQYTVRWGSGLRVDNPAIFPEFTLQLGAASTNFIAEDRFRPSAVSGNVLEGKLFFVASDNTLESTVFLRAQYIPRNVSRLVLNISSPLDFTPVKVEAGQNGIADDWTMTLTNTKATSVRIDLVAPEGKTLPFAGFGPILRLDFDEVIDRENLPFDSVTVDSTVYENGQTFIVEGFEP